MSAVVMEQRPQILARAAEGDPNSFSTLIEPLLDAAYRLAAVMLADRSAAEDAVQEPGFSPSSPTNAGWPAGPDGGR